MSTDNPKDDLDPSKDDASTPEEAENTEATDWLMSDADNPTLPTGKKPASPKPQEPPKETVAADTTSPDITDASTAEQSEDEPEERQKEVSQDDIDAMFAKGSLDPAEPQDDASGEVSGATSQNDIDQTSGETSVTETPSTPESEDTDSGDVSLEESDETLESRDEVEDPSEPKSEADSGDISQEDLDALLKSGSSEDDKPDETDTLEALLEKELKTISSDDADSLLTSGDAQDPLVAVDMEERLDGKTDDQLAEDLEVPIVLDDEPVVTEAPTPKAAAPEPPPEPEPEAIPTSPELNDAIVLENIVAGATTDLDDTMDDVEVIEESDESFEFEAGPAEAVPVAARTEDDSDDEGEEPAITAGEWLGETMKVPKVLFGVIREQPLRAITGIAAGMIIALATYTYLSANPMRSVSNYVTMVMDEDGQLRRAMTEAQFLIDEGEYLEASSALGNAMSKSTPGSPLYLDAQYIKLEADVKRAETPVALSEASRLHSEIDHVVKQAPLHPRKPEALFWKGQVYEKELNLLAARVEYREILKTESQPENRQNVLLALGELELETNRPIESAEYLQQLRREYPGSEHALKARLLLGDAFVAAGDYDSARTTFIDVAEANPTNAIGAEAFARLGELAFTSGNFDQAIRELETRLDTATTVEGNDQVTLLLAKAYHASGRLEDAKNLLNSLIDFFPESAVTPLARVELSRVLYDLGLEREAVRYATQTVQAYPGHSDVLRNAGELLQVNGEILDAARSLLAAHTAGADDPDLLLAAGKLFAEAKAYPEAKRALVKLADDYAASRQGLMGNIELSKLLYEEGRVSDALDRLEGLAEITNASSRKLPILAALGELYQSMNLPAKVAAVYGEIAVLTNEPEVLAQSATAILNAGVIDEGLKIASGIDVQQLTPPTAYAFLNAKGRGVMRMDGKEGLGYLEQAHAGYPEERTSEGVQALLEANLTLDRSARARAIISELSTRVMQRDYFMERPRLEQAAITWGNYLFNRSDYRAAVDAYTLALEAQVVGGRPDEVDAVLSNQQLWSLYQQANSLFKLSEFENSIVLYDRVARSGSEWSTEASTKAASARLEQRLRGEPVAETRNAG